MKNIFTFLLLILAVSFAVESKAQSCSHTIPQAVTGPSGSIYHVSADSIIDDPNGSIYYVCPGVSLTVNGSSGCTYYLEDNCTLLIRDHDGDAVYAKGNCTITDSTMQGIIVNMEASSTFNKPLLPSAGVVFNCGTMIYDYSLVGGSAPCSSVTSVLDTEKNSFIAFPNPSTGSIHFNSNTIIQAIEIYDLTGSKVASFNNTKTIDISAYPAGFYQAIVTQNNEISTVKLLKL